jgi:hypothetical protein
MSNKYNQLQGANHFMPFFTGVDICLHFSYTANNMYCRTEHSGHGAEFEYVEMRRLDKAAKRELDMMAANDFIGPMGVFGSLPANDPQLNQLDNLISSLRLTLSALSGLRENLEDIDPESEAYADAEAELEQLKADENDETSRIEAIIDGINRESGYNQKTRTISPTVK